MTRLLYFCCFCWYFTYMAIWSLCFCVACLLLWPQSWMLPKVKVYTHCTVLIKLFTGFVNWRLLRIHFGHYLLFFFSPSFCNLWFEKGFGLIKPCIGKVCPRDSQCGRGKGPWCMLILWSFWCKPYPSWLALGSCLVNYVIIVSLLQVCSY